MAGVGWAFGSSPAGQKSIWIYVVFLLTIVSINAVGQATGSSMLPGGASIWKGAFTNAGRSLVLFYSPDGLDWKLAKNPLVSTLNIKWANGTTQKLEALERPQLFFEDGKIVALLCAVNETLGHSYNVQIPLKSK